jgi:hypothetical protein
VQLEKALFGLAEAHLEKALFGLVAAELERALSGLALGASSEERPDRDD